MHNHLKIGCNFEYSLIEKIKMLNSNYVDGFIDEVYGSRRESAKFTARPSYRVPDISKNYFCKYINELRRSGISFNYTLNSNFIGSKEDIERNEKVLLEYIRACSHKTIDK